MSFHNMFIIREKKKLYFHHGWTKEQRTQFTAFLNNRIPMQQFMTLFHGAVSLLLTIEKLGIDEEICWDVLITRIFRTTRRQGQRRVFQCLCQMFAKTTLCVQIKESQSRLGQNGTNLHRTQRAVLEVPSNWSEPCPSNKICLVVTSVLWRPPLTTKGAKWLLMSRRLRDKTQQCLLQLKKPSGQTGWESIRRLCIWVHLPTQCTCLKRFIFRFTQPATSVFPSVHDMLPINFGKKPFFSSRNKEVETQYQRDSFKERLPRVNLEKESPKVTTGLAVSQTEKRADLRCIQNCPFWWNRFLLCCGLNLNVKGTNL